MAEQLRFAIVQEDGRPTLKDYGPRWRFWLMTRTRWVAYPDRVIEVSEMEDEHLEAALQYLSGWTRERLYSLVKGWLRARPHNPYAIWVAPKSHRALFEAAVPCLVAMEVEARRRGLEVPPLPAEVHSPGISV